MTKQLPQKAVPKAQAVAKREPQAVDRPDYIKQGGKGLEGVSSQEMTLPRLGLCQSMSPYRKKGNPLHIEGLSEGDFFNTITQEIYGGEVQVVPLFFFLSRLKFNPLEDGGGIDCQSANGKTGGHHSPECGSCQFAQWVNNESPECTKFLNYAVLIKPKDELAVVSFKSTGEKEAKKWNSLMKLRGTDAFAGLYKFASKVAVGSGQEYYAPVITNAGWVDKVTYAKAEQVYKNLYGKEIKVDQESNLEDNTSDEM